MCVVIKSRQEFKMGHVGSKIRSLGQFLEKPCVLSRRHSFDPVFMKLCQNDFLTLNKRLSRQAMLSDDSSCSRRSVVSYWRKYVHEVLVNRLGGLSLPRESVVRVTDRPNMTIDVYRGRKTTIQQQQPNQVDQMLVIWHVALPSCYQACSNEGLRTQNGPAPGGFWI